MKIIIYTDSKNSWFIPYGKELEKKLQSLGYNCQYIFNKKDFFPCEIAFILSCTKLIPADILNMNKHNIVVHASDLPNGKGFSPLQWQILEGKNKIPLTLFEASEDVDAGNYYLKDYFHLNGHELLDELRKKMSKKIIDMCIEYTQNYQQLKGYPQKGQESFYRRRVASDDEIDINKSLKEQFNHLRIADNKNYPLYFKFKGHKYFLKIYKD